MFEFEEMGSDKISTGLALDSLHKIRVSCVGKPRERAIRCTNMFPLLNMMRRVLVGPKT